MALTETKKIAVWATVGNAFNMVWTARKQHVALAFIAYLPFAFLAGLGMDNKTVLLIFLVLLSVLWLVPLHILWQRLFLVGPDRFLKINAERLFKIWIRYIGYYVALILAIILTGLLVFGAWYGLEWLWHLTTGPVNSRIAGLTTGVFLIIFSIIGAIIAIRLAPIPISITAEEQLSLRKSWISVRGNTTRFWLTLFLTFLSYFVLFIIITIMLTGVAAGAMWLLNSGDAFVRTFNSPIMIGLMEFILSPLTTAMWALAMAAQAIIYRDLIPEPEKQLEAGM